MAQVRGPKTFLPGSGPLSPLLCCSVHEDGRGRGVTQAGPGTGFLVLQHGGLASLAGHSPCLSLGALLPCLSRVCGPAGGTELPDARRPAAAGPSTEQTGASHRSASPHPDSVGDPRGQPGTVSVCSQLLTWDSLVGRWNCFLLLEEMTFVSV